MIAKAAGVLVGILVTVLWFWVTGTMPVMQTAVGLLLGIGAGLWAWAATGRGMRPTDKENR